MEKEEKLKDIYERLRRVQAEIKVPKANYNAFAKYKYRNAEDILAAATPLLVKEGLTMTVSDIVEEIGGRVYVRAIVQLNGEQVGSSFAREPITKKGSDESQITGAASSYARKYALNGVFLLDDTADADSMDNSHEGNAPAKKKVASKKDSGQVSELEW